MFFDIVEHKGKMVPRYSEIENTEVVAKLSAWRREKYPTDFL